MTYRMKYSSEYCERHYRGYTQQELMYICQWYSVASSREIALALGRTQGAILKKVAVLKEKGLFDYYKNKQVS